MNPAATFHSFLRRCRSNPFALVLRQGPTKCRFHLRPIRSRTGPLLPASTSFTLSDRPAETVKPAVFVDIHRIGRPPPPLTVGHFMTSGPSNFDRGDPRCQDMVVAQNPADLAAGQPNRPQAEALPAGANSCRDSRWPLAIPRASSERAFASGYNCSCSIRPRIDSMSCSW